MMISTQIKCVYGSFCCIQAWLHSDIRNRKETSLYVRHDHSLQEIQIVRAGIKTCPTPLISNTSHPPGVIEMSWPWSVQFFESGFWEGNVHGIISSVIAINVKLQEFGVAGEGTVRKSCWGHSNRKVSMDISRNRNDSEMFRTCGQGSMGGMLVSRDTPTL